MEFTISNIVTDSSKAHIKFTVTSGGQSQDILIDKTEFMETQSFPKNKARPFIKYMVNTFVKTRLDAGDTLAQVKTALLAYTFKME